MSETIVNKVAKSGLVVLEMDSFLPGEMPVEIDIADQLWQGIALKERDFRAYVDTTDWMAYSGKAVAVHCSADAIIPNWAYMLISTRLATIAEVVYFGTPDSYTAWAVAKKIESLDPETYRDARVIIKGCGKVNLDFAAYGQVTAKLTPVVKSIMFGEPCSTVPVYKRK
ncbi:MAG TPA: DUF2480 family protein [Cryomorphaceae bacterium]|nr:DUF2480 family protein [Cryomorphaceae bacterium]